MKLYNYSDAALLLGIHPITIRKWVNKGKLTRETEEGGKRGMISEEEIELLKNL